MTAAAKRLRQIRRRRCVSRTPGSGGAGIRSSPWSTTWPKRAAPDSQASRASTISSWVRPDEVPPHDDVVLERLPAEEEQQSRRPRWRRSTSSRCGPEVQQVAPVEIDGRVARRDAGSDRRDPLDADERVLPVRPEGDVDAGAGGDADLGTDDRRVRRGGRGHARELAHHDRRDRRRSRLPGELERGQLAVPLERRPAMPPRLGQGHPQLECVEGDGVLADRVFGMRDALAAGHEVERAAAD